MEVYLIKKSLTDKKVLCFTVVVKIGEAAFYSYGYRLMEGYLQPPAAKSKFSWNTQAHLSKCLAKIVYRLLKSALEDDSDPLALGNDRKKLSLDLEADAIKKLCVKKESALLSGGYVKWDENSDDPYFFEDGEDEDDDEEDTEDEEETDKKKPVPNNKKLPPLMEYTINFPDDMYLALFQEHSHDDVCYRILPKTPEILQAEKERGEPYRKGTAYMHPFEREKAEMNSPLPWKPEV